MNKDNTPGRSRSLERAGPLYKTKNGGARKKANDAQRKINSIKNDATQKIK